MARGSGRRALAFAVAVGALGGAIYFAAFSGAPAPAPHTTSEPAPPSPVVVAPATPPLATAPAARSTRAGFTEVYLWRTGDDPPEGSVDVARWLGAGRTAGLRGVVTDLRGAIPNATIQFVGGL